MTALCSAEQYRAKFPYCDLTDEMLDEWLADGESQLSELFETAGVDPDDLTEAASDVCMRAVRDMVHRAIGDGSSYMNGFQGSTQFFTSGEDYSQTVNMGNGFADLYMRKKERANILAVLRAEGLTSYGSVRAACAAPSFGAFD